ncbi:hypothetical protein JR316_0004097 [Psilocybe cubensis]|uniref:Uncharacterized protein n=2 Tax=Psilocybe cubensis TaxID=181762 RepID=A0ACB8H9C3_PSICU|nr:hypothetical protein JR316_0004097 [Psilocybe cubensis]KAH9484615.1 hypothetical protein JR316_0004097 [Psilocybe cubensis]
MEQEEEPWHLTIVLLEGLRLMRPEKGWRPIVTVEIDKHDVHETTLGVDGQNVNQKDVFKFHGAGHLSKVDVNVWHRSQSKKKKKKILVASASHSLGELLKKQELEHTFAELDLSLQCRTSTRHAGGSSKGRSQKKAFLRLKIKPPPTQRHFKYSSDIDSEPSICSSRQWRGSASSTDDSCSIATDDCLDEIPKPSTSAQQTLRRRIRGYIIDTDDENFDNSDGDYLPDVPSYSDDQNGRIIGDRDEYAKATDLHPTLVSNGEIISFESTEQTFVAFSDIPLPLYTEKVVFTPERNLVQRLLASLTMYGDLSTAANEDQFAAVFVRLQHEWTFIGGLLVALAAVDTAVFSISPDSMFNVDSYARAAIATSSVASGLGIACDAWFLLRYNWADLRTFITRAKDLYDSYFFFSLSARVPAFCMFISAVSLMGFLALVAFDAWPQGVIGVSFLVGIVMSMQFLVYGAHWFANRVVDGGRAGSRSVVTVVRVVKRSMTRST